jgi:hypothetical protein
LYIDSRSEELGRPAALTAESSRELSHDAALHRQHQ